jgi:ATP-independent RNA helicase DbpA
VSQFSSLPLHPDLLSNLETLAYHEMTPIQALCLPVILQGKDVIAQAKTGSGKTAAFGLGLLQKLDVAHFRVQTLVLCPTRELADQVAGEIRKLARQIHNIKVLTICGGVPFGPQKGSLEHGAHIIVGTPGRIEDHLLKGNLDLSEVTTFVLDEADRMLDMGFQPVIDSIVSLLPTPRQTLLFSATFPKEIDQLSRRTLSDPVRLEIDAQHDELSILQYLYRITDNSERTTAVRLLLAQHQSTSALVFCTTREQTEVLAAELREAGYFAQAIHGDLDQKDREHRLIQFANQSLSVLVATDVAARGLDIESIDLIINYHLSKDPAVHTHRIGRTGRAGAKGIACTIYHDKEIHKIEGLEAILGYPLKKLELPGVKLDKIQPPRPPMVTLQLDGGKKQKIRAGDILGALTGKEGIPGDQVGKINLFDQWAFIAVNREVVNEALRRLNEGKVKGRSFRARQLSGKG